ncbi:Hypothetical protein, putative [Bodo saltans]|uniref:Uncharacterized protein n=1 Tax=Bodo saltans TaxID=75058 RepID=A0A0S4J5K7_BODSA|nr:Hypothetical protein, putative [Bodo saltans]|eukprot:CUG86704.1 Hypothetical protein, putative [Bodo saltans]
MVRLSLPDFAEATSRMIQLSGLKKTKLMVKLRPSDKKIVLKSTDQRSTLTSSAVEQKDLKLVEQIISDYITVSTKDAPAERAVASKDDKKGGAGRQERWCWRC